MKDESAKKTRARVHRSEVIVVTETQSTGGRRFVVRILCRGRATTAFGWLRGDRSRMRAVVRALQRAIRQAPRKARATSSVH